MAVVQSFAEGRWVSARNGLEPVRSALTDEVVAEIGSDGLDFGAMALHARAGRRPKSAQDDVS